MNDVAMLPERGVSNRVVFKCDLAAARTATKILRTFLAEQGLDEGELFNCELCLVEACNNAVQYASPEAAQSPITAEAIFHGSGVELRVTDHTEGFDLPQCPKCVDPSRESGRGLFIIHSMMDDVRYYRGDGRNTLVMRKTRAQQQHRFAQETAVDSLEDARRQLQSCQQTISGMARELCVRSETLAAIFRCSAELGRTNDLEGFGQRLLSDLLHLTSADWFVLRLVPVGESRLVVFAASEPGLRSGPLLLGADTPAPVPTEVAAAVLRRVVEFDATTAHAGHDPLFSATPAGCGVVQPLLCADKLVGTLAIGRRNAAPFAPLEIEVIRAFAEFMAVQVINTRHVADQMHARIVAHELDIAHRIQRALLPRQLPQLPGFTLAANWESARQVGGDFYDALPLDGQTVLLVVADVMGKGVPAAMFATIMRSLLRALVGRSRRPAQLLKRLNELLYDELSSVGMFMTVQLVLVDIGKRELVAASAGHCPVIIGAGDTIQAVRVAGTPLGVLPGSTYREQSVELASPAGLFLYTDGITEALNPEGEMFGQERLLQWLRVAFRTAANAQALRESLAAELQRFCGHEPLRDDQAFIVALEQAGGSPSSAQTTRTTGDFLGRKTTRAAQTYIFPATPLPGTLS